MSGPLAEAWSSSSSSSLAKPRSEPRRPTRDTGTDASLKTIRLVNIQIPAGQIPPKRPCPSAGIDSQIPRSSTPADMNTGTDAETDTDSHTTATAFSQTSTASTATIDHRYYPHLIDMIMRSSPQALLAMRSTCRTLCDHADAIQYNRVALYPPADRSCDPYYVPSYQGSYIEEPDVRGWGLIRLPCNLPVSAFASQKQYELFQVEVRERLRRHTKCIDMTSRFEHATSIIPHALNGRADIVLRRFVPADNSSYQGIVVAFVDLSYTNRYDWCGRPVLEFADDIFYNSCQRSEYGIVNIRYNPDIPHLDQAILVTEADRWTPRNMVFILQRLPLLGANGAPDRTDFSEEPHDQPFGMLHYVVRYLYDRGQCMGDIVIVGLHEVPTPLLRLGDEYTSRTQIEAAFMTAVRSKCGACKDGEERDLVITFYDLQSYRDFIGPDVFELYTDGYTITSPGPAS